MSPRRLRLRQIVGLILLGFVVVTALEIVVAVLVARVIGPWPTLLLIVVLSSTGLQVVRRGGARSADAFRQAAVARRLPGGELTDAVLLLIGGLLMIPPGFVLGLLGLLFVLPVTRPLMRRLAAVFVGMRWANQLARGWPVQAGPNGRTTYRPGPDVIPGEVIHPDDPDRPTGP